MKNNNNYNDYDESDSDDPRKDNPSPEKRLLGSNKKSNQNTRNNQHMLKGELKLRVLSEETY